MVMQEKEFKLIGIYPKELNWNLIVILGFWNDKMPYSVHLEQEENQSVIKKQQEKTNSKCDKFRRAKKLLIKLLKWR